MTDRKIQLREVRRHDRGRWGRAVTDQITVEEPLELRIAGHAIAVIMRTPGDDVALAAGFLVTEGIIEDPATLGSIGIAHPDEGDQKENIIEVALPESADFDPDRFSRNFYATSSCGICGKTSIESITCRARPIVARWEVGPELILALPDRLRAAQSVFERTGSLHGAGLFDLEGVAIEIAEDVGRHNAVDKIIGRAALAGRLPLDRAILMVSGRTSFEITQKALMAGIAMIAAVSGASSLAADLAEDRGMTLIGFVRGESMTVYNGAWRLGRSEMNDESAP